MESAGDHAGFAFDLLPAGNKLGPEAAGRAASAQRRVRSVWSGEQRMAGAAGLCSRGGFDLARSAVLPYPVDQALPVFVRYAGILHMNPLLEIQFRIPFD